MLEGQFQLGSLVFGRPEDDVTVLTSGFDRGNSEPRTQDIDNPVGDGGMFGRDYVAAPSWGFTLGVKADSDVRAILDNLAATWRADSIRTTPGAVTTLRYMEAGRERIVYGRPRRYAETPNEVADNEWQIVETDFKLADPYCYDAAQNTLRMTLLETASNGGLVLPAVLPFELGRSSSTRSGVINVEGTASTPLTVEIRGPVSGVLSNPSVTGPGFAITLNATVAYDQTIVIDTRAKTVKRNGVSIAGALSRYSRLDARLRTGTSEVAFAGSDPSNTATATFKWRSAYPL